MNRHVHSKDLGQTVSVAQFNGDLATAVTAVGSSVPVSILVGQNILVTSNLTVPENVFLTVGPGVSITISGGVTLTINGSLQAGPHQVFVCGGDVVFGAGTTTILPEWFGALGNGGDDSFAIQTAINSVPANDRSWSASLIPAKSWTIYFQPTRVYGATNLTLQSFRNIVFDGGTPYGARLTNADTGNDYIFNFSVAATNYRSLVIKNLVLDQGGIALTGATASQSHQPFSIIQDCLFYLTPGYAIKVGLRVVFGEVRRCRFDRTGGVRFDERDADLWTVNKCQFLRGRRGADVHIASSGIYVDNCEFEQHESDNDGVDERLNPHIKVMLGPDIAIRENRFGNETGAGTTPPKNIIEIGDASTGPDTITGLRISDNEFRGAAGASPSEASGRVAILFNSAPLNALVIGNKFWSYMFTISDNYYNLANRVQYARGNEFLFNTLNDTPSKYIPREMMFENGGGGFVVESDDLISETDVNDISHAQGDIVYWTTSNMTVASGVNPGEFTCTRTAGGSSYVYSLPFAKPTSLSTLDFDAKATDTVSGIRMGITETYGNTWITPLNEVFVLSPIWRKYRVMCPSVPDVATYVRVYLFSGADGTDETSGSFKIRNISLHEHS
jgi:hypothetical protein